MSDCKSCKNWHDCKIIPEWWDYSQIRWCPYQILWLCQFAETLRAGSWPEDTFDDNEGTRQFKTEASFVKPEIIIGELDARLETTGVSGKLLVAQAQQGFTIDDLDREAYEVLMFLKGWRRKRKSFSRWKAERRYRQRRENGS